VSTKLRSETPVILNPETRVIPNLKARVIPNSETRVILNEVKDPMPARAITGPAGNFHHCRFSLLFGGNSEWRVAHPWGFAEITTTKGAPSLAHFARGGRDGRVSLEPLLTGNPGTDGKPGGNPGQGNPGTTRKPEGNPGTGRKPGGRKPGDRRTTRKPGDRRTRKPGDRKPGTGNPGTDGTYPNYFLLIRESRRAGGPSFVLWGQGNPGTTGNPGEETRGQTGRTPIIFS
jgi:hypothetical protein